MTFIVYVCQKCYFFCHLFWCISNIHVFKCKISSDVLQAYRSSLGVVEQARSYYVNWRMVRDVKRRQMAFEYADTRLRINAIRKNTILPKELQVHSKSCSFHSVEVYRHFRLFSVYMIGFFCQDFKSIYTVINIYFDLQWMNKLNVKILIIIQAISLIFISSGDSW